MLRGLFFQTSGSLTSLKSQTRDPQFKVPPGGLVLRTFTSWKNPSTSAGFEPANLGSCGEHGTRDHRGRHGPIKENGTWRIRTNRVLQELYKDSEIITDIKVKRIELLRHVNRMKINGLLKITFGLKIGFKK